MIQSYIIHTSHKNQPLPRIHKKGTTNGKADALSRIEPEPVNINSLESNALFVKETDPPINMF